jgi:cytosine/adenosine deaminase-related metal-dependent hydrolase
VLGRDDIGHLAPGMAADVIGIRLDDVTFAGGAVHDPLAALVFCRPPNVDFSIVNGEPLIEHGRFTRLDLERTVARHNELAHALVTN